MENRDYIGMIMLPPIVAGAITNPVGTAAGLIAFGALDNIVPTDKWIKDYEVSSGTTLKDEVKTTIDLIDFIVKCKAVSEVFQRAPKVIENFTKKKISDFKLPERLELSPEQVNTILDNPVLGEVEKQSISEILNINPEGVTEVTPEMVLSLTKKSYWQDIKDSFKSESPEVVAERMAQEKKIAVKEIVSPKVTAKPPETVAPAGEGKITPAVAPELSALHAEARKYKTAEEFVKSQGKEFHGTGKPIEKLSDTSYSTLNYYGQGFYTTDNIGIAEGYTKKGGKISTLYKVTGGEGIKLYDAEKSISPEIKKVLSETFEEYKDILDTSKNLRESFDKLREDMTADGFSADVIQERFDAIRYNLENMGYGGISHTGGLKTGKPKHQVKIYWKPSLLKIDPIQTKSQLTAIWNEANKKAEPITSAGAPVKPQIIPEKIKPDISGITPLQRQIQAMEDMTKRVEVAKYTLDEMDFIRENFKGRISPYKKGRMTEELSKLPGVYRNKGRGGQEPDQVIMELKEKYGVELRDENALAEYFKNIEETRKQMKAEIEANRPEMITKRETTLLKERIRYTEQGLKQGRIQTKEEIKKIQEEIIGVIESAGLPLEERAKFIKTIKNVQTSEQLAKAFPDISKRVMSAREKVARKEIIEDIQKIAERAKSSAIIAAEYSNLIRDVVNQFELQGHTQKTISELKNTKNYIMRELEAGRKVDMPSDVLDRLDILQRKPVDEITTKQLEGLRDKVEEMEQIGKTKLRLREAERERRMNQDLAQIMADSKPIQSVEKTKRGIGEKLSAIEKIRDTFTARFNDLTKKKIALTPMDAVIDELDGNKVYKGANMRIFKNQLDKDWADYDGKVQEYVKDVVNLAKKFKFDESNYERIAAYATLQQEGGLTKLQSMGYLPEEVENVVLTKNETVLLEAMRKKFDESFPEVAEVMRLVYNTSVEKVAYYFPFMTDFQAMTDFEIRDRFINTPEYTRILKKNPEMGFTKQRVGGKQKIKLNAMEVFLQHMDNVAYLSTIGKDIKYLNDLAASEEYGMAVGDIGQEMMREWLDLVARKGRMAGNRVHILDAMRKYTSGVYLGFKVSSAVIQFTSILDGAALIGRYAFDGAQLVTHKEIRNFLHDNFPEWRQRVVDDPMFLEFYKDHSLIDKAIQLGISPLKLFDKLTAGAVTIGAYKKYCVENSIDFDVTRPNPEAIQHAQLMLRRTQASGALKDIPLALSKGMLTGNISVDKLLLQFQTFLLNRWSLITHDMYKGGVKGENKTQAVNIAMWLIIATMAETLIRRKTKEVITSKENEKGLFEDTIVNAFQNVPFLGNIISTLYYNSLGIPSLDWVSRISGYLNAGNKSKTKEAKVRNFSKAILLGLPGGSQATQMIPGKNNKKYW
jgi:hypothetical protein